MLKASKSNTARAARRLLYCAVGAALLTIPALAVADETFGVKTTVTVPGAPLAGFDISFVDPTIHAYLLADGSNTGVDVIDTRTNKFVTRLGTTAGFTGAPTTCAVPHACNGPDGILTVHKGDGDHDTDDRNSVEVWAGNGDSTVKVLAYPSGSVLHSISTGGTLRADEGCWDPDNHLVLFANDADTPPFISFISTDTYKIVKQIKFDGKPGNGPNATNGIEQCQWNAREHAFYLNLPEVNGPGNDTADGHVVVINPHSLKIVRDFDIPVSECAGPQGMAIGPSPQILLGCNAVSTPAANGQNSAIIHEDTGRVIQVLANQGGADEVWFNPGDGHYQIAEGSHVGEGFLGIVDSRPIFVDQDVPIGTGQSAHSVAADPISNDIFFPVPPANSGSAMCPTPTAGCVLIFAPGGRDDHRTFVFRDNDGHHHD